MTKTEADEDGDRRRRTQSGDERRGSSSTAEDTPEWRRRNLILLSCDSLTPEPMKDAAVFAAQGSAVVVRKLTLINVRYGALTVPSGRANWSYRRPTTKLSALRPKLHASCLLHSWQSSVSSAHNFLCSVKAQRIWLADHIKQTVNTVLVGQSFHNGQSYFNYINPHCDRDLQQPFAKSASVNCE